MRVFLEHEYVKRDFEGIGIIYNDRLPEDFVDGTRAGKTIIVIDPLEKLRGIVGAGGVVEGSP